MRTYACRSTPKRSGSSLSNSRKCSRSHSRRERYRDAHRREADAGPAFATDDDLFSLESGCNELREPCFGFVHVDGDYCLARLAKYNAIVKLHGAESVAGGFGVLAFRGEAVEEGAP